MSLSPPVDSTGVRIVYKVMNAIAVSVELSEYQLNARTQVLNSRLLGAPKGKRFPC